MLLCSCKTATLFWDGGEFLKIDDTVRQKISGLTKNLERALWKLFDGRTRGCSKIDKYTSLLFY